MCAKPAFVNQFRFLPYPYSLLHDLYVETTLTEDQLSPLVEMSYKMVHLPDDSIRMLELRYRDYKNMTDIGKICGVSEAAASSKIRTALRWLRGHDEIRDMLQTGNVPDHFSPNICVLCLSGKTEWALNHAGWSTVDEVLTHIDDIINLKDIGERSVELLKESLAVRGYIDPIEPKPSAAPVIRYLKSNKQAMELVTEIMEQDRWNEVAALLHSESD